MVPGPAVVFRERSRRSTDRATRTGAVVKITDVEAIVLRQPVIDETIADGSQDDLIIRVHTDAGLTGIGEVDSSPELVASLVRARGSHAVATGLRDILVGEDPLDVERLWDRMYRGLIYFGRRGITIHAISGIDIALAEAAVAAGGPAFAVMIDAGLGYVADVAVAVRVARAYEGLGIGWLEEPFEPDEYEAYAALADAVDLPIAAGEQDSTRWGFRELIERGRVDVVQPDVT